MTFDVPLDSPIARLFETVIRWKPELRRKEWLIVEAMLHGIASDNIDDLGAIAAYADDALSYEREVWKPRQIKAEKESLWRQEVRALRLSAAVTARAEQLLRRESSRSKR